MRVVVRIGIAARISTATWIGTANRVGITAWIGSTTLDCISPNITVTDLVRSRDVIMRHLQFHDEMRCCIVTLKGECYWIKYMIRLSTLLAYV